MTKNEERIALEREIVMNYVDCLLKAGFHLSVYDGEAWVLKKSTDSAAIKEAMFSTDGDTVSAWKDGKKFASLWFIYGNHPSEVLADYSVSFSEESTQDDFNRAFKEVELVIKPAQDFADSKESWGR